MKSQLQVDVARGVVTQSLATEGLSDQQMALLSGMSVALQWVADAGGMGKTLQRLIDGEPLAPGQTASWDRMRELARKANDQS